MTMGNSGLGSDYKGFEGKEKIYIHIHTHIRDGEVTTARMFA